MYLKSIAEAVVLLSDKKLDMGNTFLKIFDLRSKTSAMATIFALL